MLLYFLFWFVDGVTKKRVKIQRTTKNVHLNNFHS